MAERESWHLDRKVPISIIVLLVFQTMAWVWVAAKQDARLKHMEEWKTSHAAKKGHAVQVLDFGKFEAQISAELSFLKIQIDDSKNQIIKKVEDNSSRISRQWDVINEINGKLRDR